MTDAYTGISVPMSGYTIETSESVRQERDDLSRQLGLLREKLEMRRVALRGLAFRAFPDAYNSRKTKIVCGCCNGGWMLGEPEEHDKGCLAA